jgi:hypothetical protein
MFAKENDVNEKHVAKQNLEEPYAIMLARTDLRESREGNFPRPPGISSLTGAEIALY